MVARLVVHPYAREIIAMYGNSSIGINMAICWLTAAVHTCP